MAEFKNDLLREAIADAEQVRETAIANAKLQLEESIAPTIKAELTKALSQTEEVAEAIQETEEVDEAHDPKGAKANDFAEVGEGIESADVADEDSEVEIVSEDESTTDDVVEGEATVSEEAEEISEEVEEAESVDEIDITVRGATTTVSGPEISAPDIREEEEEEEEVVDDEEEDEDLEDLDLEAIIADLQREVDALEEDDEEEEEEEEIPPVEDDEEEEEVDEGDDDEEEVEVEDEEDEDEEEVEEDLDLDAILREIEAELSEEDETELAQENTRLQSELDEYRKAVELLRGKLNEVNLLNAKLLFTNKLFKGKELSQDQKIHVVETFDLATTIREVKLLYATLAEATINVPTKQKKQTTSTTEVVAEGIASKVVGGTAPTTEVLEEDQFAGFRSRMKQLAGLDVL
jgi:hypothetical protein